MPKDYIATVQILIPGDLVEDEATAADFVSSFFQDTSIKDWSYLKVGGHLMSPSECITSEDYEEGEAFA